MEKMKLYVGQVQGQMTYIEILEMAGINVPDSPRERNMLNVMSYLPEPSTQLVISFRCINADHRLSVTCLGDHTFRRCKQLQLLMRIPLTKYARIGPMAGSMAVFDLSQTILRTSLRVDGILPTLCCNSKPWAFRLGRVLSVAELRFVAGMPQHADFTNQSDGSARRLLGNKMHVSDVGAVAAISVMMALGCLPVPSSP